MCLAYTRSWASFSAQGGREEEREGGDGGGSAEKMEYLFDTEEGPQTSAKPKCQNQLLKKI